jgi:hypothetical protein
MKKVLFLALCSLVLMGVWTLPADARGTILIGNDTPYTASVSLTFYACRGDHPFIPANGSVKIKSGLCVTKSFKAVVHGLQCISRNDREYSIYRIGLTRIDNKTGCGVGHS